MLKVELAASIRKEIGKGAMRQMRMKGMTPAVVYGGGAEALPLKLETQPFFQQLLNIYRKNAIVSLNLDDGSTKHVMVQDVQTDPIKDTLLHADFLEIDIDQPRLFKVPIRYTGTAKGCDLGGVLNVIHEYLAIEAAPMDVPDEFVVDVTHLNMGDSIKVGSIDVPEKCKLMTPAKMSCVSVGAMQKGGAGEEEGEEATEASEGAEA